ncbi:MAG: type III secretion system inner membrane ring subunit SctD [Desulfovibrio sp.]|nr:type III secretion system inner membrane ring subunit SctD [Desulfovibrio sp.]
MDREIQLTIFTGTHAGAEIRLPPGDCVFGSAEDCDIILSDSTIAPRHCVLTVSEKGALRIRPLEGTLTLNGRTCTEPFDLPEAVPVLAGLVCFAWARDGRSLSAVTPPSLFGADGAGNEKTGADDARLTLDSASGTEDGDAPAAPGASRPMRRRLLLGAVILLLLGLTVRFLSPADAPFIDVGALEGYLRAEGFNSLLVSANNGRAVISGLVAEPGDADKVRALAAKQSYPVQVVVRDREDFINTLRSILAAHGLFLQIAVDNRGATLLGYALDSLVERAALSWARTGLPHYADIRSGLLTRKDVEGTLRAKLAQAGLGDTVHIDWQAGVIVLSGPGADSPALPGVIRDVCAALRSPLAFQRRSISAGEQIYVGEAPTREAEDTRERSVPEPAQERSVTEAAQGRSVTEAEPERRFTEPAPERSFTEPAPASPNSPFGASLNLRSVTPAGGGRGADSEGLPFITVSDGRLYFIGGTLPGGYVLTGVYPDRLEFSRNGVPLVYKLLKR